MKEQRNTKAQLIAELSAERQRRVELEAMQRRSEQRFRRLVERAPDIIFYLNLRPSPHFDYISPSIEEITGYSPARFYADPTFALSLVHPEDRSLLLANPHGSLLSEEPIIYRLNAQSGKEVWLEQRQVVVKDDHDEPVAVEGIARDRTEQVLSRAALQQSLHEKELLLKEIHHRVKNNLTLVGSLLELQAAKSDDEHLREMLAISQKRLLSVARIHEALYLSEDLGQIDLKTYIMRLGNDFAEALGNDCRSIRYDLEEVTMALRDAVQFGLILNEMVSNAFKHAFPPDCAAEPTVGIQLRTSPTEIRTTISDNGIGLPADFDLQDNSSLGMQIVRLLTGQLGGTLEYTSTPGSGTIFTVRVPADPGDGVGAGAERQPGQQGEGHSP